MRIAHLADIHLGYRAYNRTTRFGLNVREADVFNGFRQALGRVAEIAPDLVVIAGDMFHVVRPSNLTIDQTFREFVNFRMRSRAPIVLIGGNHDSPRSTDTGCILDLFKNIPDTYIVHNEFQAVELPSLDTTVYCLCHRAVPMLSSLKVEPNPASKYNVLTVHGTLEGVGKHFHDMGTPITRSQIIHDGWDYIALGHYHVFEKMDDRCYYSGSLDYTSPNIWAELGVPKGFVEFDLDNRELVKFHEMKTREVVDLRAIDAEGMSAAQVNDVIMHRVAGIHGGHEEKIVRLVVENVPRAIVPDLDYRTIRQIRMEALHFDLQLRPPKRAGLATREGDSQHTARPLEEEWREFAKDYPLPGEVERESMVAKGVTYLENEK
jgi:hypothetical protein